MTNLISFKDATVFGEPRWTPKPRPSYGVELISNQEVKLQMRQQWESKGCVDAKKPARWVVAPKGKLLSH